MGPEAKECKIRKGKNPDYLLTIMLGVSIHIAYKGELNGDKKNHPANNGY
ncbi:MAG: hypothetical protein JWM96_631 [Alphaproteobacteria bacterium]|nr:hypothetical protein [Alphaproteobacteria bacterium]